MKFKEIICFIFGHKVVNYSDKTMCSATCKRCSKVLILEFWENIKDKIDNKFFRKYFPKGFTEIYDEITKN